MAAMKIWENIISVVRKIQFQNNFPVKISYIREWFKKLTSEQKRQFALLCTGVFVFILTLSVIISVAGVDTEKQFNGHEVIIIAPIPAGELFLPEEPDFIPGVLLERSRRSSWTMENAAEHWQDPLRLGEEQWRERIEAAIDELLERVP